MQLELYDHIILIAGGIGITAIAPMFIAAAKGISLEPSQGPVARYLAAIGLGGRRNTGLGIHSRGGSLSLLWAVSRLLLLS